jgi:hypothetical protein
MSTHNCGVDRQGGIGTDVYRRALRFNEELAHTSDLKTVVRRFCVGSGAKAIFMQDILVSFSVMMLVVDVPSQRLKELVNELDSYFRLIEAVTVCVRIAGEMLN